MLLAKTTNYATWDTLNKVNVADKAKLVKATAALKDAETKDCKAPQTTTAEKKACTDATTKVTTNATDIAAQVTKLDANKTWYTKNKDKYTTHNLTVAVADDKAAVTKI